MGLKRRLDALWSALLHEHSSPGRLALAVWLGCIVGTTPFFGLHFFICVAVAFVFRVNKLVTYAAANISIPPLAPALGYASVQVGERVLRGRWPGLAFEAFNAGSLADRAREFFVAWLLGGALVGAVIGSVGAAVTYVVLKRRRVDPLLGDLQAATRLYESLPRNYYWYVRMKYRLDPVYRALVARIPEGAAVVDLGAGLAMLGVLLAVRKQTTRYSGLEWDADKAAHGARVLPPPAALTQADVTQTPLPRADVITIVDVLHYFDDATVDALLDKVRASLNPGGRLLVRDGDAKAASGAWTRALEWLAVRFGWNKGARVYFRSADEWRQRLEAKGFSVSVSAVAGKLHPANVLLDATPVQP